MSASGKVLETGGAGFLGSLTMYEGVREIVHVLRDGIFCKPPSEKTPTFVLWSNNYGRKLLER